jgi:hypothetical protein
MPTFRRLYRHAGLVLGLATLPGVAAPARAQAVKINQGRILPFEGVGVVPKSAGDAGPIKGANTIALYSSAFLGSPGAIGDLPPGERVSFHYATLHLLFSAAALPGPRGSEVKASGNLQRLNGHVNIVPLDSMMQPITDLAALAVLATFPDTILLASAPNPDTGSTKVSQAAFGAATSTLLPELEAGVAAKRRVGTMIASFKQLFHHPSARIQVAYVSELREFGWMWYEHADDVIEGTHRASAALEVAPNVRYLSVRMRVVADWRSHGAWQRDMEVVLDLGRAISP